MKQLTKEETQQIFDFYKIKELKYYDLQIELVDHFASSMETNWETYPNDWSFHQKINSIYEELGFKGFRSIVRGKSMMVFKSAYKSAFNYVKKAFKIPQIFLTIALIYLLSQGLTVSEDPRFIYMMTYFLPQVFLGIGTISLLIYYYLSFKKKIFVFEQSFSLLLIWTVIPNLLISTFNLYPNFPYSSEMNVLISTLNMLHLIFCMGALMVVWRIFLESKSRYEGLSKA